MVEGAKKTNGPAKVKKIMLVDDDSFCVMTVKFMLESLG